MTTADKFWGGALAAGCLAMVAAAVGLNQGRHLDHDPNVLTVKGSPYGRTLAYAMRGPADLYWHRGQIEEHGDVDENPEYLGLEEEQAPSLGSTIHQMKTEFDEEEAEHAAEEAAGVEDPPPSDLRERLLWEIGRMRTAYYTRTNEFGDTPQIAAWRYRETEKRLKLSHELDPTNLICYGSYFLFVSESVARLKGAENETDVIARRQDKALGIAVGALDACLKNQDEPAALITAASAANDAVTLLRASGRAKPGAIEEMQNIFGAMLARYVDVRNSMVEDGSWESFSPYRRHEMEEVFSVLRVIHLASAAQASVDPDADTD